MKIAVLVDPQFLREHVGVQTYIISLCRVLHEAGHNTEFIAFSTKADAASHWSILTPAFTGEESSEIAASKSARAHGRKRNLAVAANPSRHGIKFYRTEIGSGLKTESYDGLIISAPWLEFPEVLRTFRFIVGVVYDLVPNIYAVDRPDPGIQLFAACHRRGYEFYNEYCSSIVTISKESLDNYVKFFGATKAISALPPLMPWQYFHDSDVPASRKRNVVLAAPFDLRKGLNELPEILNGLSKSIDRLDIYGGVRCALPDAQQFFSRLRVSQICWYKNPSTKTVRRLFSEARVLVFPSLDEGLGLPVIEAQLMGCRVVARNKKPMSDLTLAGSYLLNASPAANEVNTHGEHLIEMLCDDSFDHVGFARKARMEFAREKVAAAMSAVLSRAVSDKT